MQPFMLHLLALHLQLELTTPDTSIIPLLGLMDKRHKEPMYDVLADILASNAGQSWGDVVIADNEAALCSVGREATVAQSDFIPEWRQQHQWRATPNALHMTTATKYMSTAVADAAASRKRGRDHVAEHDAGDEPDAVHSGLRIQRLCLDTHTNDNICEKKSSPVAALVPHHGDDDAWRSLTDRLTVASAEAAPLFALALAESNVTSLSLAVETLGVPAAVALLRAALTAEANGGVPTADGARRRSAGGVFFLMLKDRLEPEAYKACFQQKTAAHTAAVNARRRRAAICALPASTVRPPSTWGAARIGGGRGGLTR